MFEASWAWIISWRTLLMAPSNLATAAAAASRACRSSSAAWRVLFRSTCAHGRWGGWCEAWVDAVRSVGGMVGAGQQR